MPPRTAKRRAEPRKQPKQPRSRDTVEVILTAAERILARDGLDGLTTARIAEVAGISVGSLYQYFPNKEAICGALIERTTEQIHRALVAALEATASLPYERAFGVLIEGMLTAFRGNARMHAGLMEMIPVAGRVALYRRILERHTEAIAHALSLRGAEVRRPARLVAYVLVAAADGVIQKLTHDPIDDAQVREVVREVVEMGVAYLRPPKSAAP